MNTISEPQNLEELSIQKQLKQFEFCIVFCLCTDFKDNIGTPIFLEYLESIQKDKPEIKYTINEDVENSVTQVALSINNVFTQTIRATVQKAIEDLQKKYFFNIAYNHQKAQLGDRYHIEVIEQVPTIEYSPERYPRYIYQRQYIQKILHTKDRLKRLEGVEKTIGTKQLTNEIIATKKYLKQQEKDIQHIQERYEILNDEKVRENIMNFIGEYGNTNLEELVSLLDCVKNKKYEDLHKFLHLLEIHLLEDDLEFKESNEEENEKTKKKWLFSLAKKEEEDKSNKNPGAQLLNNPIFINESLGIHITDYGSNSPCLNGADYTKNSHVNINKKKQTTYSPNIIATPYNKSIYVWNPKILGYIEAKPHEHLKNILDPIETKRND